MDGWLNLQQRLGDVKGNRIYKRETRLFLEQTRTAVLLLPRGLLRASSREALSKAQPAGASLTLSDSVLYWAPPRRSCLRKAGAQLVSPRLPSPFSGAETYLPSHHIPKKDNRASQCMRGASLGERGWSDFAPCIRSTSMRQVAKWKMGIMGRPGPGAQGNRKLASAKHFQVDRSQRFFFFKSEIKGTLDSWREQRNISSLREISMEIGDRYHWGTMGRRMC